MRRFFFFFFPDYKRPNDLQGFNFANLPKIWSNLRNSQRLILAKINPLKVNMKVASETENWFIFFGLIVQITK